MKSVYYLCGTIASLLTGLPTCASAQPLEPQLSGYVTAASDALVYGVSQSLDDAVIRLGIDYQHTSGFFAGGTLGNVSFVSRTIWPRPRETVLETYAGYQWRTSDWGLAATFGWYVYPDTTYDYDYGHFTGVVDFRGRYFYSFTYTDDLSSLGRTVTNHELAFVTPFPSDIEVGAALGRFEARGATETAYTHFNVGATKLIGRFGLDLRYYETSREVSSYFGSSPGDRWVFSLSYAIRRRN